MSDMETKAREAGLCVSPATDALVESIFENKHTKTGDEYRDQYFKTLALVNALYCLIVDRIATELLSSKQRHEFSDVLIKEAVNSTAKLYETPADVYKLIAPLTLTYITSLGAFCEHLFAEKDESPKGTLFWEYLKIFRDDVEFEIEEMIDTYADTVAVADKLAIDVRSIIGK